jgi:hypothetical protein
MVDTRKGASGDESSHELLPAGAFLIEYPRFQLPHLPQQNSRTLLRRRARDVPIFCCSADKRAVGAIDAITLVAEVGATGDVSPPFQG